MSNLDRPQARPNRSTLLITAAVVLAVVGVGSSLARYLLPHALHLTITRPLYGGYATDQLPVLAAHPVSEALHRLGGALYMILGLLQFSTRLRARRPGLHRALGRVFLLLTVVAGASGAYMGATFPYVAGERVPSVLFGTLLVVTAAIAFARILRGDVQGHREWITRSFAIGLGIGTIRVLGVILINTTSWETKDIIAPLFWIGWTVTLAAAELRIRATRPFRAVRSPIPPGLGVQGN